MSNFPKPFVITIGVIKGGDCKTWIAFNLASWLGIAGHRVVVVDMNQQHDLVSDHHFLIKKGFYPRFDVVAHTPLDPLGRPGSPLDLSGCIGYDFILADTSQYLEFPATKWAWEHCHLMIMPVTPNKAQQPNYEKGLQAFFAFPGKRPPIAILPTRAETLKNAGTQKQMMDFLAELEQRGCEVPSNIEAHEQIYENPLMGCQETRWAIGETFVRDKRKVVGLDFLCRVDLSFKWLRWVMRKHYGDLPQPRLPVLDYLNRTETLPQLAKECGAGSPLREEIVAYG